MSTAIEWTDETWNPVRGCSIVSEGCRNCYAMKQAHRFNGPGQPYEGLTELGPHGPRWTGSIWIVQDVLDAPLHWKTPRRIFVNSMSDLFHEAVPDEFIDKVFITMGEASQHTFQILTKRPERMKAYMDNSEIAGESFQKWPLPNVWLGVSVEDQKTADERIPILLQTPAAVRFVSAEPLLGPVEFDLPWPAKFPHAGDSQTDHFDALRFDDRNSLAPLGRLDWVIVGGESGPGARPCDVAWIRSIVQQCKAAAVPCFVKQLGSRPNYSDHDVSLEDDGWPDHVRWDTRRVCIQLRDKKGGDPAEWPADLRVREWPK